MEAGNMDMLNFEKEKIELAVGEAENLCNIEFVPIVFKRSDFYSAAHFRLGVFLSMSSLVAHYYIWNLFELNEVIGFVLVPLFFLMVGYLLAYHPSFKRAFITKSEIQEEVNQRALEVFFKTGLHATEKRNTVMILLSLLERRIEIIVDSKVSQILTRDKLSTIIAQMSILLKEQKLTEAFILAISECVHALKSEFPPEDRESNVMSNEIKSEEECKE